MPEDAPEPRSTSGGSPAASQEVDGAQNATGDEGQQGSSAARKRPVEIQVAVIALFAALGGAIAGAVLAGVFSYLVARTQVTGATERSHEEFLRTQRQAAYAAFLADAFAVHIAENNYANLYKSESSRPTPSTVDEFDQKFHIAFSRLYSDLALTDLVGTANAGLPAEEIVLYWEEPSKVVSEATKFIDTELSDEATYEGFYPRLRRDEAMVDPERKFINQARNDLGTK